MLWLFITFSSALFRFFSFSGGVRSRRTSQASFSRGMTLRKMSVAMKSEQIGSAINQPNWRMRMVEMITPTLPKVSARTWRKTPDSKQYMSITSGSCFPSPFFSLCTKPKHTPLMLAFMPPPPELWEWPCPPCPCPLCPWPPWEWPWPPWLCSLWEWPWCEWPWSCDEQLLPPWEWAWLKAQIPTRLTSRPPTDTGCRRQSTGRRVQIDHVY